MASIAWNKLSGQPEFDRVVEAFFVNHNSDLGTDAYAVNGKGGDKGIDIHIRRDGCLIIVQLKFFPEGFSSGWKTTRRRQITESFKAALQHDPDEWWLVIPTTATPSERKFVMGLPAAHATRPGHPKVTIFDRPMLDGLASRHPDLVAYFTRDELMEAAQVYNQENAMLVDEGDLAARVAALAERGATLDPDWRLGFFADGKSIGTTVIAKHAQAAERSPITISLTASFSAADGELRGQFENAIFYGAPGRVDLPASAVSNFSVDGPKFIRHQIDDVAVTLIPVAADETSHPFTVVLYDAEGRRTGSFAGKTTWIGRARAGFSLHVEFFNVLTLKFALPKDQSTEASLNASLTFAGNDPTDAVRATRLIEQFGEADSIGLEIDGKSLARMKADLPGQALFGAEQDEILLHSAVAADLVTVQEATSQYFAYPEEIGGLDRVYLRCVHLMLEGRCVVMPDRREVTITFNGDDNENSRKLLSGEWMSLCVDNPNLALEIFGHSIELGNGRMYAPRVAAVDSAAHLQALDAGNAAGRMATLRAADEYGFWMYLPERLITDEDERIRPVSLGLPGVRDAPDIARALEGPPSTSE